MVKKISSALFLFMCQDDLRSIRRVLFTDRDVDDSSSL